MCVEEGGRERGSGKGLGKGGVKGRMKGEKEGVGGGERREMKGGGEVDCWCRRMEGVR